MFCARDKNCILYVRCFKDGEIESRHKLTMCRLCLCENEFFINIFEVNDWQGYVAAEVISDLFQFKVSETDGYPQVVCSTCLTKLTDFKLFKEFCQKSKVAYDKLFIPTKSLEKHQQETINSETVATEEDKSYEQGLIEIINDSDSTDGEVFKEEPMEDVGVDEWGSEMCKEDLLREASPNVEYITVTAKPLDYSDNAGNVSKINSEAVTTDEDKSYEQGPIEISSDSDSTDGEVFQEEPMEDNMEPLKLEPEEDDFDSTEEQVRGSAPENGDVGERSRFDCRNCKKVLPAKGILKMTTHGIRKPCNCEVCDNICVSESNLIIHSQMNTHEIPYKCTDCSTQFRDCSSLKVHMQIHTKTETFKCKECNLSFNQNEDLEKHMRLHLLKPYGCEVCHATFMNRSSWSCHSKSHSKKELHKCDICSKEFTRKRNLNRHQLVHSNNLPHQCIQCHKRFKHQDSLTRHLKKICVRK